MRTLFESIIDETRKSYSPYVFDRNDTDRPILKQRVRDKIESDIDKIREHVDVEDYFIKGSILTKKYSERSDIDVFVKVDSNLSDDELYDRLYDTFREIDDTTIEGVPHPFQYYITSEDYDFNKTEAAYSLTKNEWIKRIDSKEVDIDDYLEEFNRYVTQFSDFSEDLRRNMIDYELLKDIPNDQVSGLNEKLKSKLEEIENDIEKYINLYIQLRDFRSDAFDKEMTPKQIKEYGIKTRLPGNVVFKLIERYYYADLAKKLRDIIGKDGELQENEYKQLNDILKKKLTNEKTNFKQIFKGKINGRGDMQHKPSHRQQSLTAGMKNQANRKSLNIMPDYQRNSPLKGDGAVKGSKKHNQVLRVKQGSPQAKQLAAKYRIADPRGKKTVAGNQHDGGITIIFEETLEQKVARAQKILETKLIKEYFVPDAAAFLLLVNGKMLNVPSSHLEAVVNHFDIEGDIYEEWEGMYGETLDFGNTEDINFYDDWIRQYMEDNSIFAVVVDPSQNQIYVRPNGNSLPTKRQIKSLKDWAIENGYDSKIKFDKLAIA